MYVILWQFNVRPEKIPDFVSAYRAAGDWAQLFPLAPGYVGTQLLVSADHPDGFVTIDRWTTVEDYRRFHERFDEKHRVLNSRFEGLMVLESNLGAFLVADS